MTIKYEGLELFSMVEAVAEIAEHTGEQWEEVDLLKAAATNRIQVLCHAEDVFVDDHRPDYDYSKEEGDDEAFEEIAIHINPIPKKHTGFFYPAESEGGEAYLKALSKGQKTECGITTLVSGAIGDIERCFDRKGYSPSIDKFYINNAVCNFHNPVHRLKNQGGQGILPGANPKKWRTPCPWKTLSFWSTQW